MTDICAYCQAINNGEEPRCDNYPGKGFCPVSWKPTFFCSDCGDVEVKADGQACAECVAAFQRQQKPVRSLIEMIFKSRAA